MHISLINPPKKTRFPQPPLGLAYVAAVLEKAGHTVDIIDAPAERLTIEQINQRVIAGGVDAVGITVMTPTVSSAIATVKALKAANPNLFIFMGGPHATLLPQQLLEVVPELDSVVFGEGEITAPELVAAIKKRDFKDILGIAWRDDKNIVMNPPRPHLTDLDGLPMPAYHLLPINKYRPYPPHGKRLPYMAIMTSRGCPYRCAFCSKPVHGRKFLAKSPNAIIAEIEYLHNKFGIKELLFYDDSFTVDRKRVVELCDQMIKKRMNILWSCETRVNLVDKELLKNMAAAKCYIISYGVESGNQQILNNLKKDITIEQVETAFALTHDAKILTVAYFMLGSPGDDETTMRMTIDFAKKIDPDFAQFSICTAFPGTELADMAKKRGIELPDWDRMSYVTSGARPVSLAESVTPEQLVVWYNKAYKEFYLRPRYLLKKLLSIRNLGDIRININGLKMLTDVVNR